MANQYPGRLQKKGRKKKKVEEDPPPYMVWAENWYEEGFRIQMALEDDSKEEFVKLIRSPMLCDAERPYRICDMGLLIICFGAVRCADAVLSGETNGIIDPYFGFPKRGWTALHEASLGRRVAMLETFLNSGYFSANLRGDDDSRSFKQALPLNVILSTLRGIPESERSSASSVLNTLFSKLDYVLEAIRFLAFNTTELQQEFFNYAKQGKLVEVGALLLAAGEKLLPLPISKGEFEPDFSSFKELHDFLQDKYTLSAINNDGFAKWKETLKLLDIYDKLGNHLAACVALKKNRRCGDEVATLLEAQGSDVKIGGNKFVDYVNRSNDSSFKLRVPQTCFSGEVDYGIHHKLFLKPNVYPSNLLIQKNRQTHLLASSHSSTRVQNLCSKPAHVTQLTKCWFFFMRNLTKRVIFV